MKKKQFKALFGAYRAAMRGDWAQTRPEQYPEEVKTSSMSGHPWLDWMALGTRQRFEIHRQRRAIF